MKSVLRDRRLPKNSPNRLGFMTPKWITIHETSDGLAVEPEYKNYNRYWCMLQNGSKIGYHFLIEARHNEEPRAYQFLETNVKTAHTGNTTGNAESIGIERLVNKETDFEVAIALQAKLAASLMKKYAIPIDHVVPHKFWSGKECPARLLAGMYGGWEGFIEKVQYYFDSKEFIEGIL